MSGITRHRKPPKDDKLFVFVYAEDADLAAKEIRNTAKKHYKDIPLGITKKDVDGKELAFIWSKDPDFRFGLNECNALGYGGVAKLNLNHPEFLTQDGDDDFTFNDGGRGRNAIKYLMPSMKKDRKSIESLVRRGLRKAMSSFASKFNELGMKKVKYDESGRVIHSAADLRKRRATWYPGQNKR